MSRLSDAIIIDSDSLFDAIEGESTEAVFEYRFNLPFKVDKDATTKAAGDDTVVYGPVYVGDKNMLDRHRELVDAEAILKSWETYAKNPVILYNHRKDYGVIGLMESVEMGIFETDTGEEMEAVFGRAIIDSGEIDITRKINKGMLRAFSIGFIAKAAVKEGQGEDAYIRFTNIEWIETSVVDIPASPNALFDVSKSLISYGDETIAKDDQSTQYSKLDNKLDEILTRLSEPIGGNTLKDHVADPTDMTEAPTADDQITEEVIEDLVELSEPTEVITLKTEEVVEEEAVEEEDLEEVIEEVVEEAVEEEAVEELALDEEVVTEVAEATEEESIDEEVIELDNDEPTMDLTILSEVVKALSDVEAGLKNLTERLDETETLKAMLAEKVAEIETLSEQKSVAEAEAVIETEVSRRLAEKMVEVGIAPTPAAPKSLSANEKTVKVKTGVTKHDPTPSVSNGMAHLGAWLEGRLSGKRTE